MSIAEVIQQAFSRLSLQWYDKIKNEFYRHPFYVKDKGIVSSSIFISGEEEEIPVDITFEHYLWDNSINEAWFNLEDIHGNLDPSEDYFLFRPAAKLITRPILATLRKTIAALNTVQEKDLLIKSAIRNIYEIKYNSQSTQEIEYNIILDHIAQNIINEIKTEFAEVSSVLAEIQSYHEGIKIEINQNELAILILLLYKSEIILDTSEQPQPHSPKAIHNPKKLFPVSLLPQRAATPDFCKNGYKSIGISLMFKFSISSAVII